MSKQLVIRQLDKNGVPVLVLAGLTIKIKNNLSRFLQE